MTVYAYLDKNVKGNNTQQLMSKVPHIDIPLREGLVLPSDAELISVHGVKRGNDTLIQQATQTNTPWLYMDNGYFGKYKRVVVNATAPITFREGRRFEHNTELKPWRGGQGEHIIVLPPSYPYMDTFGCHDFLNHVAHNVNLYTDRDVIIRAKPAKGRIAKPWEEQIENAYAVITWGSALALDAMIRGVPTISLGWCPGANASFKLKDLDTTVVTNEPDRMGTLDNLTWSSFERDELPNAYDLALENFQIKDKITTGLL